MEYIYVLISYETSILRPSKYKKICFLILFKIHLKVYSTVTISY